MEVSHNQCQDLKARYEGASAETEAKHAEAVQKLQQRLLDVEGSLAAAQEQHRDLLQEMVELRKQADKARVRGGENRARGRPAVGEGREGAQLAAADGTSSAGLCKLAPSEGARPRGASHTLWLQVLVPDTVLLRDSDGCRSLP